VPAQQKRILLFEDDFESMRDFKEHIEEELGWYVELTAAKSLLERLSREQFDLIVVDLMIQPTSLDADGQEVHNVRFEGTPWLRTGLEFLRQLRKGAFCKEAGMGTSPDVHVLILSAVADYSARNELGKDIHIEGYIEKPFRLEDLVERMYTLLQG
jgi:CheY-like chemotaxis protein